MCVCVCVCVCVRVCEEVMYLVSFDHKYWCSIRAWHTFLLDCWHKVHN